MITKQMRNTFKVTGATRIKKWMSESGSFSADKYFKGTEKQRILILRRTFK